MTKEDICKLDNTYNDVKPIVQLLRCVNRELGVNTVVHTTAKDVVLRKVPEDSEIASCMFSSMFHDADSLKLFDELFREMFSFNKTVEHFKRDIIHNDKFFFDIGFSYRSSKDIASLASAELWETVLNAREKFFLDLKKTLEKLLEVIPSPQFPEIETKN